MWKKIILIGTLIPFLETSVFAQPQLLVVDQHKGLQRNPKADKIEDGAHAEFTNVYIDDANITSVKGRDRLNSTANADVVVNMFCYYENAAGTTKKLVVKESDEVVTYDTDGTNRTQIIASLTNERADCTQIGDTLYFNSSTDGLHKWTGSGSASAIAGVAAGSSGDFSLVGDKDGGMTTGFPAIVSAKNECSSNKSGFVGGTCIADPCHVKDPEQDTSCLALSAGDFNLNCAGSVSYEYKIVPYNSKFGILGEASSSNSVSLTGANEVVVGGVDCFPLYTESGGTCTTFSTTKCQSVQVDISGGATGVTVTVTGSPVSPFDTFRFYRTTAGGSDFFLDKESSVTFNDGKPDTALFTTLDTTIDTITPPSFRYIESYKGVIVTAENAELRFSRLPVNTVTDADKYWLETDQLELSSEQGFITGLHKTSDSLVIFTGKSIQELTGFGVTSFRLRTLVIDVGGVSDETIETDTQGDILFFAGTQGVYKLRTFQQPVTEETGQGVESARVSLIKLSANILDDVFLGDDTQIDLDPSEYPSAHAYYDLDNDLYFLYIGDDSLVYDNRNNAWSYIPAADMDGSVYRRSTNAKGQGVLLDNVGFFFNNWLGFENGIESGTVTGTPTAATSNTLTDSSATFNTTGNGLKGLWIFIDNENEEYHQISSNTATIITISDTWTTTPISSDDYYITYIVADWKTKQYQFDKAPRETNMMNTWLIHNKADSSQDLEYFTFEEKSTTPSRQLSGEIDLSAQFVKKLGSRLRSSWVQWSFKTFIYNISDTISKPLDITSYAFEFDIEEER